MDTPGTFDDTGYIHIALLSRLCISYPAHSCALPDASNIVSLCVGNVGICAAFYILLDPLLVAAALIAYNLLPVSVFGSGAVGTPPHCLLNCIFTSFGTITTMDDGTIRDLDFTCAYIMLFERRGERWVRLGDVSTFK